MSQSLKKAAVLSMCKQWWLDQPAQDCEKENRWLDNSHHMRCPIIISQVYINKIRTLSNSQQVRIVGWSQSKLSLHAVITVPFLMARLNVHSQSYRQIWILYIKKNFSWLLVIHCWISMWSHSLYGDFSDSNKVFLWRNKECMLFFFYPQNRFVWALHCSLRQRQWMKINDAMTCISSIDWYRTGNIWIKYENNMNSKMIRDFMNLYNFTKKP